MQRAACAAQPPMPAGVLGALKQRLKQTSTALQLDSGAAISLSQEAQQLLDPVLQLVALSEVRD